jgi:hypothetical protein
MRRLDAVFQFAARGNERRDISWATAITSVFTNKKLTRAAPNIYMPNVECVALTPFAEPRRESQ